MSRPKRKNSEELRKQYQKQYVDEHYRAFMIRFRYDEDADVIDWLNKQKNISESIRKIVRAQHSSKSDQRRAQEDKEILTWLKTQDDVGETLRKVALREARKEAKKAEKIAAEGGEKVDRRRKKSSAKK